MLEFFVVRLLSHPLRPEKVAHRFIALLSAPPVLPILELLTTDKVFLDSRNEASVTDCWNC
jgi:hypothetical protein